MSSPVAIKQYPKDLATSPEITYRRSSFASSSSPWFRRNSFLSKSMINDEKHSVYESSHWSSNGLLSFNISLKESQGFVWNQDLFASPYQQSRSLFNERRYNQSFPHSGTSTDSNSSSSIHFNEDEFDDEEYENDDDRRMNYKVEVTDIIIDDDEMDDLFPSDD